jgi:ketosteroid isomerase-like protein
VQREHAGLSSDAPHNQKEDDVAEADTPQQVFERHGQALAAQDVDAVVADYTDDAVWVTPDGVFRGQDALREAFGQVFAQLPNATWDIKAAIFEGDVLLLVWGAHSERNDVDDGVDTFVFRDGLIRAHTASFTLKPNH